MYCKQFNLLVVAGSEFCAYLWRAHENMCQPEMRVRAWVLMRLNICVAST